MWIRALVFLVGCVSFSSSAQAQDFGGWWFFELPDLECWGVRTNNGSQDTFIVQVTNHGQATAPSTWLDVWVSTDRDAIYGTEVGDVSDQYVRTKPLATGQTVSYTFPIPRDVIDDALLMDVPMVYESCVVDTFRDVFEDSEADNAGHWDDQVFVDLLD